MSNVKEQSVTHTIYLIHDLSGNKDGYVGWTIDTPEKRLKMHFYDAKVRGKQSHCSRALRKLKYHVGLLVLEVVPKGASWEAAEQKWIKHYRDFGWNLWNMTDGGDGTHGYAHSKKRRKAKSLEVKAYFKNNPEARRKTAESVIRFYEEHPEARKKLSIAHVGVPLSPSHRRNIGLGGKGKKKKNGPNISRYWKLHPGGRTASGIKSWETRRANKNLRRVS